MLPFTTDFFRINMPGYSPKGIETPQAEVQLGLSPRAKFHSPQNTRSPQITLQSAVHRAHSNTWISILGPTGTDAGHCSFLPSFLSFKNIL